MKKFFLKSYILSAALLFLSIHSFGQIFVGDVNINSSDRISIVEVFVGRRGLGNSVRVYVDFGQRTNPTVPGLGNRHPESTIVNPQSKSAMVFKSTAAVLNFFEQNNWDYVNCLSEKDPQSSDVFYYFKKRKSGEL